MATSYTTTNVGSGFQNSTTINQNFSDIETALKETINRLGNSVHGAGNQMEVELDMNSNKIINLGEPINPNDAARLKDVKGAVSVDLGNDGIIDDDSVNLITVTTDPFGIFSIPSSGELFIDVFNKKWPTADEIDVGSKTQITPDSNDLVYVEDVSDGGAGKKVEVQDLGSGGGSSITFDAGNDGNLEILSVSSITTDNDFNSIFSNQVGDRLNINAGKNWPVADRVDFNSRTQITPKSGDEVVLNDKDDNYNQKKALAGDLVNLAAGGTSVGFDKDNDSNIEINAINIIATRNDTNNIFVEDPSSSGDLLIQVDANWPQADTVDINSRSSVGLSTNDEVLIADASDSFNNKKAPVSDFVTLSEVAFDAGNDNNLDVSPVNIFATVNDTNNIFSAGPGANELLIDAGKNWPKADDVDIASKGLISPSSTDELIYYDPGLGANRKATVTQIANDSRVTVDIDDDGTPEINLDNIRVFGDTYNVFDKTQNGQLDLHTDRKWPEAHTVDISAQTFVNADGLDEIVLSDASDSGNQKKTTVASVLSLGKPYNWTKQTANYTVSAGEGVLADTSGGSFTITLPASPSQGDAEIPFVDSGRSWDSDPLTIDGNGNNILGASTFTADVKDWPFSLVYNGTEWIFANNS